ncbi:MAG TPA: HEAT repeat domain-containing protein, partial [Polyangia bacterium]|nr:HEAT repeat domain-containing protein [Polyangia bacterium]
DVSPVATAPQLTSAQRGHALMDAALAGEPVDRRAALLVIAALRTRHGLDAVTRALGDGEPEVRRAAAEAAGAIGQPSDGALRAALAAATEASGGAVALDIAVARAALGDDTVVPELQRARTSPDVSAHLKATLALTELHQLPPSELHAALAVAPMAKRALRWQVYATLYRLGDARFRQELTNAIAGGDARADDRAALDAAVTLAAAGDARGRTTLAALARVDDTDVHQEAEAQLAEAGDAAARDVIVVRLAGGDVTARPRAALALARLALHMSDGGAFAALARALGDGDRVVRLTAAAAFWSGS